MACCEMTTRIVVLCPGVARRAMKTSSVLPLIVVKRIREVLCSGLDCTVLKPIVGTSWFAMPSRSGLKCGVMS